MPLMWCRNPKLIQIGVYFAVTISRFYSPTIRSMSASFSEARIMNNLVRPTLRAYGEARKPGHPQLPRPTPVLVRPHLWAESQLARERQRFYGLVCKAQAGRGRIARSLSYHCLLRLSDNLPNQVLGPVSDRRVRRQQCCPSGFSCGGENAAAAANRDRVSSCRGRDER